MQNINQIIVDRKNDVGVLKALGFSNWNISSIFLQSTSMFVILSFIVMFASILISYSNIHSVYINDVNTSIANLQLKQMSP